MLLEVSRLSIHFQTEVGLLTAVDNISFHLDQGEILGVVGESGCGKSVTALSLMRLLREPPAHIEVASLRFQGEEIAKLSAETMGKYRGRQMGMIFQEPMTSLNPVMRIGSQVGETLEIHFPDLTAKQIKERVLAALNEAGIADAAGRYQAYPHELSGGLRQRVMIAMALIAGPKLLIADEPTTALDVTIQAQILKLLRDLQEQRGLSVLLISHDFGVMAEVADRILVMYAGKIVEVASWKQLLSSPLHPYTQGLLKCIPGRKKPRQRLDGIPGSVPSLNALPRGCRFQDRCYKAVPKCRESQPELETVAVGHSVACFEALR